MRKTFIWAFRLMLLIAACCLANTGFAQLPVFPGAEGFGTSTVAGRGGTIYRVNTLEDNTNAPALNEDGSYCSSLRAAVKASGPRTIVFEVGGVITLGSMLRISNPYITIAGQTAPGQGIMLRNFGISITTHDVLIQHLAIRPGDEGPDGYDTLDAMQILSPSRNVVIDHCSLSWAIDENADTWTDVRDVTFSNCIISEGLMYSLHSDGKHSKGYLAGRRNINIAFIKNLQAHNETRNPMVYGRTEILIANNVFYNGGAYSFTSIGDGWFDGPPKATVVGNLYKDGPGTTAVAAIKIEAACPEGTQVYEASNYYSKPIRSGQTQYFVATPPVSLSGITFLTEEEAIMQYILTNAGSRPAARDAVDNRIANPVTGEVITGTGRWVDTVEGVGNANGIKAPGGWPDYPAVSQAFNAGPNPKGDDNGNGYTNLEELLHQAAVAVESGGSALIGDMTVNDEANAADWSIQTNIQSGDTMYGDRAFTFTSVPSSVRGCDWIRTANDSKAYTTNPLVSFKINAAAEVYVAHNDLVTVKPAWMSGWTDSGEDITNSETDPKTFSLYKKNFAAGSRVSLGNNSDEGTSPALYTVIVKAITHTLSYHANGGTGHGPGEREIAPGATFITATAGSFTAPGGKKFREWNTAADGTGTGYAPGTFVTMSESGLSLYAIWEIINYYTVTYNINGGTGTAPTDSEKAQGEVFISAAAASFAAPNGKQFKQWNTAADGTGTGYPAGATVTMPGNNLVLYATWEEPTLISNMRVYDTANEGSWSRQSNIQSGDLMYGDRTFTFTSMPSSVVGCEWIRTANNSKSYTSDPLVTFTVNAAAEVYIAHNDLITSKPSWMSGWTDTGEDITNSETASPPRTFSLYKKTFGSGSQVSLGNNGSTSPTLYSIIVKKELETGIEGQFDGTQEFRVYPNPFGGSVNINNADKLSRVIVTNLAGLRMKDIENPTSVIYLGDLTRGIYFMALITKDGAVAATVKIIKQQ